jgi:hypothetical protein
MVADSKAGRGNTVLGDGTTMTAALRTGPLPGPEALLDDAGRAGGGALIGLASGRLRTSLAILATGVARLALADGDGTGIGVGKD